MNEVPKTPQPRSSLPSSALPPLSFWQRLGPLVFDGADSSDTRLRKSTLLLTAVLTNAAAGVWMLWFALEGIRIPLVMVLGYPVASLALLAWYVQSRNFRAYSFVQLSLFLVMPVVVQADLGGYLESYGFVLLSMLAPLGALLAFGRNASLGWFGAYLVLVVASAVWHHGEALDHGDTAVISGTTVTLFGVTIGGLLSTVAFFLLRYLVLQRERFQVELAAQHHLLQAEREKSEALLGNLLPPSIARRLRDDPSLIADSKSEVTVMFADIVEFTRLADALNHEPRRLVDVLNHVFRRLDHLCERYGLEKIKTVGDAYMVVGGLDTGGGGYVEGMAEMALDLQEIFARDPVVAVLALRFHVGIATGPAIAGVIGSTRFSYDVWGDTVNIAARLTAEAPPGTVFVDEATHERLTGRFDFGPAREISVKGKDRLNVYQLLGRADPSVSPNTAFQSSSAEVLSLRSASGGTRA